MREGGGGGSEGKQFHMGGVGRSNFLVGPGQFVRGEEAGGRMERGKEATEGGEERKTGGGKSRMVLLRTRMAGSEL